MGIAWPTLSLSRVAEIITGTTPPKATPEFYNGRIPFVTPGDLDGAAPITNTHTTLTEAGAQSARLLPRDAVLVCCIGSLGKVGIAGVPLVSNQQINAIIFDEQLVLPRYGYHFARTLKPVLEQMAPATTIAIVNKGRFSALKIPVPPISEQRRTADILDRTDAIRCKRKDAITLTEELLRSTFLEMFGDPVANPKGWPTCTLGSLLTFLTSGSRGWAQYYADSGDKFLRIQNVKGDCLDLSDIAYVQASDTAEARRTLVQSGDVLLSITADLGRTAVVPQGFGRAFINQHLAILRPQGIEAEYLSSFLASSGGQIQFERLNRHGVKAGLNFEDIRSIKVMTPPPDLQRKFVTIKERIRTLQAKLVSAHKEGDKLFNSLVHRAFRGELTKPITSAKTADRQLPLFE